MTRAFVAFLLFLTISAPIAATGPDDQGTPVAQKEPTRRADFLFGQPRGSFGVRGGWVFASAGSDLFDFVTKQLTLDKQDFNAPGLGLDLSLAVTSRFDVQTSAEFSQLKRPSEYRAFVDNRSLPIEQHTSLETFQVSGSVRMLLAPRGERISEFAYVPRRLVPYVGAGGGATKYDLVQSGDFVDFVDHSVFADSFVSSGWAPSGHVFGGVEVQIHRALYGTLDARYTKAAGKLGRDFIDFDPIDLSGFRLSAGLNLLF